MLVDFPHPGFAGRAYLGLQGHILHALRAFLRNIAARKAESRINIEKNFLE
jgi:predicted RNA-binding protein YlqC (UPF0109 family)